MAGRITQDVVEGIVAPTSQLARITQDAVEAVVLPTSEKARITQHVVEVVVLALTIDFTGTPLSGRKPLAVTFTATVTGGTATSYEWDFGDGTVSTEVAPTHIYPAAGTYTVTLLVHTAVGAAGLTRAAYITVTNPATPTTASLQVWVDWEANGFGLGGTSDNGLARMLPEGTAPSDDITADVKSITWRRGSEFDVLGGQQPGTATIIVRNEGGKYNPDNTTSPLFGFLEPGRPVWVGALADTGATFGIFAGYLEEIVPVPGTGKRDAQLICKDPFGIWSESPARVVFSRGRTAKGFREAILDSLGEPGTRRSLAEESDGLVVSGADTENALDLLEQLNVATGTRHWIQPAPNKADWYFYRTRNRGQNLGNDSPIDTLDQDDILAMDGYRRTLRTVVNVQRVGYHPLTFGNPEAVWAAPVPLVIEPSASTVIVATFGTWVDAAVLVVTSSAPLSISSITNYGRSALIELAATASAIVSVLQVRGSRGVEPGQQAALLEDAVSQTRYRVKREGSPIDSDLVGSEAVARAIGSVLLAKQKDPRTRPSVQIRESKAIAKGLPRDLYDIVTQTVAELSLTAKRYEIVGISGTAEPPDRFGFSWTYLETLYQSSQGLFRLDISLLDGPDVLGP